MVQVCAKLTVQDTNVKIQVGTSVMASVVFLSCNSGGKFDLCILENRGC